MLPRSSIVVTGTPAAQALVDRATLKSDLGISSGDTSQDARLDRLIASSAAAFAKYCGRIFIQQTYIETFRITSSPPLYYQSFTPSDPLPALEASVWPVVSVTSIVEAGTTLDSSLYFVDKPLDGAQPGRGFVRLNSAGAEQSWAQGVTVATYVAGFNLPTVTGGNAPLPADLYEAALIDVRARFYAKDRDASQVITREEVPDEYSVSYDQTTTLRDGGIAAAAMVVLDLYRRPNWA